MMICLFVFILTCFQYGNARFCDKVINTRSLVGVLMCKGDCKTMTACASAVYDTRHLLCKLLNDKVKKKDMPASGYTVLDIKERSEGNFIRLKTKIKSIAFVKATIQRPDTRSRLIIGQYRSRFEPDFRQAILELNSTRDYPYLSLKNVVTMAYISVNNKLLISQIHPNQISLSKLDSNDGTKVVKKGVRVSTIAVDQKNKLVFMAHRYIKSFNRMNAEGQSFRTFKLNGILDCVISNIAVDTVRMYMACGPSLISWSYNGRNVTTLAKSNAAKGVIDSLSFDLNDKILYFNDGKMLKTFSVSDNSINDVTTLKCRKVRKMEFANNYLYAVYSCLSLIAGVDVVDLKTTKFDYQEMYDSNDRNVQSGITFCIVP